MSQSQRAPQCEMDVAQDEIFRDDISELSQSVISLVCNRSLQTTMRIFFFLSSLSTVRNRGQMDRDFRIRSIYSLFFLGVFYC